MNDKAMRVILGGLWQLGKQATRETKASGETVENHLLDNSIQPYDPLHIMGKTSSGDTSQQSDYSLQTFSNSRVLPAL